MATLDLAITAGADDGRWNNSVAGGQNPFYSATDTSLSLGSVAAGFDYVSGWLRFSAAQFTGTPTITAATLTLHDTGASSTGTAAYDVFGVKQDGPTAPTDQADAMGRPLTTATVTGWNPGGAGAGDVTLDVTSILQELVSGRDYVTAPKAVMLYILSQGTGSAARDYDAYEQGSGSATLSITYDTGSAPSISGSGNYNRHANVLPRGFAPTWNTDVGADAAVAYATDAEWTANPGVYPHQTSTYDGARTATTHTVPVGDLTPATTYHYAAVSSTAAGSTADADHTVTLPAERGLTLIGGLNSIAEAVNAGGTPPPVPMQNGGTADGGTDGTDIWTTLRAGLSDARVYNQGQGGSTAALWNSSLYELYAKQYVPATGQGLFVVLATLNDGDTAQALADHWTLCDTARGDGWRVLICTAMDRNNGTLQTAETHINPGIRADWASHADAMLDLRNLTSMSNPLDTSVFQDGIHPTPTGNANIGTALLPAVQALQSPTATVTQPSAAKVVANQQHQQIMVQRASGASGGAAWALGWPTGTTFSVSGLTGAAIEGSPALAADAGEATTLLTTSTVDQAGTLTVTNSADSSTATVSVLPTTSGSSSGGGRRRVW